MTQKLPAGTPLPTRPEIDRGRAAEGYTTPEQDRQKQIMCVPPGRVIPIIFLPGIMGSNLRMSKERQKELEKGNNIAWRPDRKYTEALPLIAASPEQRQRQLDPTQTEVDMYDKSSAADERHDNVDVDFKLDVGIHTPLLMDDPQTTKERRTKQQKARARGWGEVMFSSYGQLLQMCEERLNTAFADGKPTPWWTSNVLGVAPSTWQAHAQPALQPLTEDDLRKVIKDCWFPVHAMGYNWLQSNKDSGTNTAGRIKALIQEYRDQCFVCEKVILVTHSMGGLVARAVIHPDMGNLQDSVLGIVHGVMPAIGAGAAYRRMRCGFEGGGPIPKVLGNEGHEVTAVLANSIGGLELLPSQAYGNNWLHVRYQARNCLDLPVKGDPYEEIYKLRTEWYRLFKEEWINPADLKNSSLKNTFDFLDKAKKFHNDIVKTYHPNSYAHYGVDGKHSAWHHVTWEIDAKSTVPDWTALRLEYDSAIGQLGMKAPGATTPVGKKTMDIVPVKLNPPAEPGDQTVPAHSADHQMRSGVFKGIFRQSGYDHQDSYKNNAVLCSTLYSLVRIAQTMTWNSKT